MKLVKPFRGLRPTRELASRVASHPYDVLNREEAIELASDNPYSFLHINKPEVDVDSSVSVYDPQVYAKGRENLDRFIAEGTLCRDDGEMYYVYRQQMDDHIQTGLVAAASVEAYENLRSGAPVVGPPAVRGVTRDIVPQVHQFDTPPRIPNVSKLLGHWEATHVP